MKTGFRNSVAIAVLVASAALAGCSSSSSGPTTYTGKELAAGVMGVGPVADKFGQTATIQERLANAKQALQDHSVSAQALQTYSSDLAAQPGDPFPATMQTARAPTETELANLATAMDQIAIPSQAQFEKIVNYVISEIDRRTPTYLPIFAKEMQSGDPARVSAAMKVMRRTLVAVFESDDLAALVANDPDFASAGVMTQNTGGGSGTGSGGGTPPPRGGDAKAPPVDPNANKGFDPVVVPNQKPTKENTYKWDQYAVGTRAAVGAYVGAAVAVAAGAVVWVVVVKGVGPFIPLANMHDQNPGDPLEEEMSIAHITKNLAHQ